MRSTVRFSDEVDVLLADPNRILVEVGPGGTLTASATRHPKWSSGHRAVRLMRHHAQNRDDRDAFLLSLGQLWEAGVEVDWAPLRGGQRPRLLTLPGYPFERQRHWIEHRVTSGWVAEAAVTNGTAASAGALRGGANPSRVLEIDGAGRLALDRQLEPAFEHEGVKRLVGDQNVRHHLISLGGVIVGEQRTAC